MITNRQIARLWVAKEYTKLYRELMFARPEAQLHVEEDVQAPAAVAALAIIRLDELSQSYLPLFGQFIRAVLTGQEADGGWGDLVATALCVRALLCDQGDGVALRRGLDYLANLQKMEGIWPAVPIRRMPEDAAVSLFVLHQLGDQPRFRAAVRFTDALAWFALNEHTLDRDLRNFWERTSLRCGNHSPQTSSLFAA